MPAITLPSIETVANLVKRQQRYCTVYGRCYYRNNRWNSWGRWVTLGCVLAAAFLFFFCCSCFTARRRKSRGHTPYYGTGWLAPNHGPVQYYGNNNQQPTTSTQQTPYYNHTNDNNTNAPAYEPNSNAGYYGGQNTGHGQQGGGIELQQPGNTYQPPTRGEEDAYAPPPGPPPNKR